jgi:hypothetical protein
VKRLFLALLLLLSFPIAAHALAVSIKLTWTASTDPFSTVTSYNIWRNGVKIGTSATTSYTDTTVTRTTQYSYTISAVDAAGNESAQSLPIVVTSLSDFLETPGPSLNLYNDNPYYTCVTNRYVSTTGLGTNDGLTVSTPWDIQTAAATSVPAGTCINLATGVYQANEVDIQFGGTNATKTGYVVWRCSSMPFSFSGGVLQGEGTGCVLRLLTTGQFNVMRLRAGISYVMIDGIEFDGLFGNANSVNCFDNAVGVSSTTVLNHHIWIFNSDFHGCGQAGISSTSADYWYVIHNVWHDNSSGSCVMGSGLSHWQPVGLPNYTPRVGDTDNLFHSNVTNVTYHLVMTYNVGYHNFNPQGACGATANTDGEGIILDRFDHPDACPPSGTICPFAPSTLIMGNVMYNNGGQGIQQFATAPGQVTTIVNNTMYSNNWDTFNGGTWRAGGYTQSANGVTWWNNVSVAVRGAGILANNSPFVGQQAGAACNPTNNTWANNLSAPAAQNNFDGGACNTYPTPSNVDTASAGFTNQSTTAPNFGLTAGSGAVGLGQAFDLWQQSGQAAVDSGACPRSAPGPTTACP